MLTHDDALQCHPYVLRYSILANLTCHMAVGGIDRDGTGAVYGFDPVGSYERESCRAAGSAQSLIQPFLDNQVHIYDHQHEAC